MKKDLVYRNAYINTLYITFAGMMTFGAINNLVNHTNTYVAYMQIALAAFSALTLYYRNK